MTGHRRNDIGVGLCISIRLVNGWVILAIGSFGFERIA
jgi:hypothetical protein